MSDQQNHGFVPIKDENGNVRGIMDQATADYLASTAPDPSQASIDALLNGVTRVRIVPVENLYKGNTQPTVLFETTGAEDLASFRRCFAIQESEDSFGHCMCLGDPHFELYAGDQLAATIGYHHGVSIRWSYWKHDAHLQKPGLLLDWLSAHGVNGPREEVENMSREYTRYARDRADWLDAVPEYFSSSLEQIDRDSEDPKLHQSLLQVLESHRPDQREAVLDLFDWFGAGSGRWSGYPSNEGVTEFLLLHYSTALLIDALLTGTPSERQWQGAARYFGGWDFGKTKPNDRKLLSPELKQRLLQAAIATGHIDNIERANRAFGSAAN